MKGARATFRGKMEMEAAALLASLYHVSISNSRD